MIKDEILDRMLSFKGGGAVTDEAIPNKQYYASVIESLRETAIREEYRRDGIVDSANYQPHYLVFEDESNEEDCEFYNFYVPQVIRVNDAVGSFGYVGSADYRDPWQFYESVERYSNLSIHSMLRPKLRKNIVAYYDRGESLLKVTQPVKGGIVTAMFRRPEDVPTFNVEIDDYPMSGKAIEIMMEIVASGTIQYFIRNPQDKVSNSQTDIDLRK